MEENKKLFKIIIVYLLLGHSIGVVYTQTLEDLAKKNSENYYIDRLKKIAEKNNRELQGFEFDGVVFKKCYSQGKTLIWLYSVPQDWQPYENAKRNIIDNYRNDGMSNLYFQNGINVEYRYLKGNILFHKIYINSDEFATYKMSDLISIKGHPKSLGVDMQFRIPNNWVIEEGERPHVVKKISFVSNSYQYNSFMILILENNMFVSRNEARELFADNGIVSEMIESFSDKHLSNSIIHNHRIISIDKYPALEFTVSGIEERAGLCISSKTRYWIIYFEDKIVLFQAGSFDDGEFERFEPFYLKIINSVIFPEQYER